MSEAERSRVENGYEWEAQSDSEEDNEPDAYSWVDPSLVGTERLRGTVRRRDINHINLTVGSRTDKTSLWARQLVIRLRGFTPAEVLRITMLSSRRAYRLEYPQLLPYAPPIFRRAVETLTNADFHPTPSA